MSGARFAFKANAQVFPLSDVLGQYLYGDRAAQPGVARFVHFAHASSPDGGDHFIGAEFFAW